MLESIENSINTITYLQIYDEALELINSYISDISNEQQRGDLMKIERKCMKCGAKQENDKTKSNENWKVYDNNAKCKCGGEYGLYVDGRNIRAEI